MDTIPEHVLHLFTKGKRYNTLKRKQCSTAAAPKAAFKSYSHKLQTVQLPQRWDWREQVGTDGLPLLTPVQDQGQCGSCYAVATVDALASRLAISTQGSKRVVLSPQDMINCGQAFEDQLKGQNANQIFSQYSLETAGVYDLEGCDGGFLTTAANFLVVRGASDINDLPYVSYNGEAPNNACDATNTNKYYASKAYAVVRGEDLQQHGTPPTLSENTTNIMMAVYLNGPVVTGFTVFDDFMVYPSQGNVYQKASTMVINGHTYQVQEDGGHAVQIVGWDTIAGKDVWILKNQWSTSWGINGYAYIRRGVNEVGIESNVVELKPDLLNSPKTSVAIASSAVASSSVSLSTPATGNTRKRKNALVLASIITGALALACLSGSWMVFAINKKRRSNISFKNKNQNNIIQ